jgi:hypothetical protein
LLLRTRQIEHNAKTQGLSSLIIDRDMDLDHKFVRFPSLGKKQVAMEKNIILNVENICLGTKVLFLE